MKKNLLIMLLPAFLATSAYGQTISFSREDVEMKLDASHLTVSGEYTFRNNYAGEAGQTVFFPLIVTGDLKIDTFSVYDESEHSFLRNVRKLRSGLFFQLSLHSHEQKKVRIFYSSDHDGNLIKYLVKTNIGYWNQPVLQGVYTLQINDLTLIVDSTSYKPDEVNSGDARITYSWRKANFLPDKELEIWFHKKK